MTSRAAQFVMDHPIEFLVGFALTLLLEWPIRGLLDRIERSITIPRPAAIPEEQWTALTTIPGRLGAAWIGRLERLLFFVAIAAAFPEVVVGWLAFKVASKWEAWGNAYKIPEVLPNVDDVEYLLARTRWGGRTFQRSLLGTSANLLAAIAGVAVAHLAIRFKICI